MELLMYQEIINTLNFILYDIGYLHIHIFIECIIPSCYHGTDWLGSMLDSRNYMRPFPPPSPPTYPTISRGLLNFLGTFLQQMFFAEDRWHWNVCNPERSLLLMCEFLCSFSVSDSCGTWSFTNKLPRCSIFAFSFFGIFLIGPRRRKLCLQFFQSVCKAQLSLSVNICSFINANHWFYPTLVRIIILMADIDYIHGKKNTTSNDVEKPCKVVISSFSPLIAVAVQRTNTKFAQWIKYVFRKEHHNRLPWGTYDQINESKKKQFLKKAITSVEIKTTSTAAIGVTVIYYFRTKKFCWVRHSSSFREKVFSSKAF